MSLLSHNRLIQLIADGIITADPANVNAASIDITLGDYILVENHQKTFIDPTVKNSADKAYDKVILLTAGYFVGPGEFFLAPSREVFNLPDHISCEYKLKSGMARSGLDHLNAGWCDAGWNGSVLTLEFKNELLRHAILIKPGMKCGQMVFFEHEPVPREHSYASKGQYNGDLEVKATKEIR